MKKIALLLAAISFHAAFVHAAGFNVFPTRIELTAKKTRGTLEVTNTSDSPTVVQMGAVLWRQIDGKNDLAPTEELIVTPPVFTLQPGKKQVVRLALQRPADERQELAYRLFVSEVPDETRPASEAVSVALQITLPVFVSPKKGEVKPKLEWSAKKTGEKQLQLTLKNSGTGHIQIGQVNISGEEGKPLLDKTLAIYLLAGQTGAYTVELDDRLPAPSVFTYTKESDGPLTTSSILLKAKTDGAAVETRIDVK